MSKPDLDIRSAVATLRAETRARLLTLRAEREAAREAFMARRRAALDARASPPTDTTPAEDVAAIHGDDPQTTGPTADEVPADLPPVEALALTMDGVDEGDLPSGDDALDAQASMEPPPDDPSPADETVTPIDPNDGQPHERAAIDRTVRTDIKLRITAAVAAMTVAVPEQIRISVPAQPEAAPTPDEPEAPAAPTTAPGQNPFEERTTTPLDDVAMLGPGLVRRLKAMGITTAEALASTDLGALSAGFGRLGAVVNLRTLSEAAKAACHPPSEQVE